jgi:methyl-accepting chemotaxis protein
MGEFTDSVREELITELRKLIEHTEEIFLRQGDQFPELLREMDGGLDNASRMIECLRGNRTEGCPQDLQLQGLVSGTKEVIENAGNRLQEFHARDDELLRALDSGIERLSALEEDIRNIKDDSEEMELVSLNAMTVALKAGNAGRAFSYITDELKRLSARTISLTDTITDQGTKLLREFRGFRDNVGEVKEFHNYLFGDLKSRLYESFDSYQQGIDRTADSLAAIRDQAQEVRTPMTGIMETVQLQDIIKQSIDHVIISLEELKELSDPSSEDEQLDELAFFAALPRLSMQLLGDIRARIADSIESFRKKSREARQAVEATDKARKEFVESALSKEEGSLPQLYEESAKSISNLLSDLDRSLEMKNGLAQTTTELLGSVSSLEENFRAFSTLIRRFHSIDVASRIEVAKQAFLRQMAGTAERMTDLTRRIESDVEDSLNNTKQFTEETSHTVSEYRSVVDQENEVVNDIRAQLQERYDQLYAAQRALIDTINNFQAFTGKFMTLFDQAEHDLGQLTTLLHDIDRIRSKLAEIESEAQEKMRPLLRARSQSEWNIKSDRLKQIIERFTIFTHKQTAGEMAGFEVESGVEAGEVTLFE